MAKIAQEESRSFQDQEGAAGITTGRKSGHYSWNSPNSVAGSKDQEPLLCDPLLWCRPGGRQQGGAGGGAGQRQGRIPQCGNSGGRELGSVLFQTLISNGPRQLF